jgi:chromosome partitioning protein
MQADAIVIPVCNSLFDRDSAADCHAELMAHPRVSSGRCKLGVVGMRIDARTRGADALRQWAHERRMPFWGVLREAQVYVKTVEHGLTLFDLPAQAHMSDLSQWRTILDQLAPVARVQPPSRPESQAPGKELVGPMEPSDTRKADAIGETLPIMPARAHTLMPAQGALVYGARFTGAHTGH